MNRSEAFHVEMCRNCCMNHPLTRWLALSLPVNPLLFAPARRNSGFSVLADRQTCSTYDPVAHTWYDIIIYNQHPGFQVSL